MAQIEVNGTVLAYEDTGGDGPVVVFSHGLLWSRHMFRHQLDALKGRYRCIAYDHRGQGDSATHSGRSVPIETVYADAVALIGALDLAPCHFVGLSMGGFVGMRIAARRPDLLRSVALLETAPDAEPAANVRKYSVLTLLVRLFGVRGPLADKVMPIMFGPDFLSDPARAIEKDVWRRRLMAHPRSIVKAVRGVTERSSVTDELASITTPTLVLWGTGDQAIARERARLLVDGIAGAKWVEIEGAGHTSSIEAPEAVSAALEAWLDEVEAGCTHPTTEARRAWREHGEVSDSAIPVV